MQTFCQDYFSKRAGISQSV